MATIVWNKLSAYFGGSSDSEDSFFKPFPSFGASEWSEHLRVGNVIDLPIPAAINEKLESPCPFWNGKQVKETHLPCLVLQGMGLKNIYQQMGHGTDSAIIKGLNQSPDSSYWFLITKKPIPFLHNKNLGQQEQTLQSYGYGIPTVYEAGLGVIAGKHLGNILMFSNESLSTRCVEQYQGIPLTVGYDAYTTVGVSLDHAFNSCSVAGVFRGS